MIDKDALVNYEENKDDPNWNAVFRQLQDSEGVFKIGKLIVHPGAKIDIPGFLPSEKRGKLIMDLDVLELVSGMLFVSDRDRLKGGHLAYSESDNAGKTQHIFQCKSKSPVCNEYRGFVLKQNSEIITYEDAANNITIDLGNNSRLIIYNSITWRLGDRDHSSFKIGENSQVAFDIDTYQEFHIEIGNNCKVLHTETRNRLYGDSAVVQKKKLKCRRPIKIKDNTTCLLVN